MIEQWVEETLSFSETLSIFFQIFLVTLFVGWVYVFRLGQLILQHKTFQGVGASGFSHWIALKVFVGLWAFSAAGVGLGFFGLFSPFPLMLIGVGILLASRPKGEPTRIKKKGRPRSWAKVISNLKFSQTQLFVGIVILLATILSIAMTMHTFFAKIDDHFLIVGGHLAKTGHFLTSYSAGRSGMAILMAMVKLFFPNMSGLNTLTGLAPFYPVFLVGGFYFLLRELKVEDKYLSAAILILIFPIFIRSVEVRSSITGFVLLIWNFVFMLRVIRTGRIQDHVGAVVTLASTWHFGQVATLVGVPFWIIFGLSRLFVGKKTQSTRLLRVLRDVTILEAPFIVLNLWLLIAPFGEKGVSEALWLPFIALGIVIVANRAYQYLPKIKKRKTPNWLLPAVVAVATSLAFFLNTPWDPSYGWFYFKVPTGFLTLNFASYGLWGGVLVLGIVLACVDQIKGKLLPSGEFLLLGFVTTCFFQVVCPIFIGMETGGLVGDGRAHLWELWKDVLYYWNPVLIVLASGFVLSRMGLVSSLKKVMSEKRVIGGVVVTSFLCLQTIAPYQKMFDGKSTFGEIAASCLSENNYYFTMGQQSHSWAFLVAWAAGVVPGLGISTFKTKKGCRSCGVYYEGGATALANVWEYLMTTPREPNETVLMSQSVLNLEHTLNLQVRYSAGPNTVSPLQLFFLKKVLSFESYWKPENRIRLRTRDSIYTVTEPQKYLNRVSTSVQNGAVQGHFSVQEDGQYEVFFGSAKVGNPSQVAGRYFLNSQEIGQPGSQARQTFGVPTGFLKAGRDYEIQVVPSDQGSLKVEPELVVHPWRLWALEEKLVSGNRNYGGVATMRHTGVPSAKFTVEELSTVMSGPDNDSGKAIVDRHKVGFILMDLTLQAIFPGAVSLMESSPSWTKVIQNPFPVFRFSGVR